ncbi:MULTISPECIES: ABC transporter permease [unclassified Pseudactinotalea]|uniref:ABC transporter permease n=1 Tax=unclassified Pseudactinotalea TaxID=2649176 RepID=UPI00128AE205|nr:MULTISPECIES: ABC transporter permease [unclassified Pseudactinotalea]MPV50889.1 ABC transporter permease [Pseudactinotalea sp. HY160]QGH70023.1 ABC transporter permease [Pseudactinotalea sp. HY158]
MSENVSAVQSAGPLARVRSSPGLVRNLGLIIALVLLCVVGAVTSGDQFVSSANLMVILSSAATIGIMSIGMTFVITGGGIDLSVGSMLGLATVWATTLATQTMAASSGWFVIAVTAVLVGAGVGLVNGIIIAYGRVEAFIATLAMMVGARGLAEIISGRHTQLVDNDAFLDVFRADVLGVPAIVWMFLVVAVAGWFLLNRTTFGRRTIAVGGNPEAARLAGIKVKRHTMYLYALAGTTVGIAAITMLARTRSGSSTNGTMYELDAIAAVVIGGTLLMGGRGTIFGTVLGVLIFSTLTNVFIQNNLSTSAQSLVKGAIIVIAVLLQQRFANRGSS